jgi:hypothetical protein
LFAITSLLLPFDDYLTHRLIDVRLINFDLLAKQTSSIKPTDKQEKKNNKAKRKQKQKAKTKTKLFITEAVNVNDRIINYDIL